MTIGCLGQVLPGELASVYKSSQVGGAGVAATVPYVIGNEMSGFDPTKGFVTNSYGEDSPGRNALLMPSERVEAAERINGAAPVAKLKEPRRWQPGYREYSPRA